MKNIYSYIEQYGKYTFEEVEFNEIDAMIFSFLTYANYQRILKKGERLTLEQASELHAKAYVDAKKEIIAVRDGMKLLYRLKDVKRYKDCWLSDYVYLGNKQIQFSALAFEYKKGHLFIAFEGTDALFSGWKENFLLGCDFPTISHQEAIHYMNKHFTFMRKSLIVGGHSKGGNLALVASMYANVFVRMKIKMIYNGDGPGLLDK